MLSQSKAAMPLPGSNDSPVKRVRALPKINMKALPPKHPDATTQNTHTNIAAVATTELVGELSGSHIDILTKLGEGSSGAVFKVMHRPTNTIMARKSVTLDPSSTPMAIRELTLMHAFQCEYIVKYYGCYTDKDDPRSLYICMEYCDLGALDQIAQKIFSRNLFFTEDMLGVICVSCLKALHYLHRQHRVIHRDIKPSNILVTSSGQIKLSDFGVSGNLVESMANTFVGTSFYMAPERIQGNPYTVRSDVWSLGITMLELAVGKFPYPFVHAQGAESSSNLPIFEVLDYIINQPVPSIPPNLIYSARNPNGRLSEGFQDFITHCLVKDSSARPTPDQIAQHGFVRHWADTKFDSVAWTSML